MSGIVTRLALDFAVLYWVRELDSPLVLLQLFLFFFLRNLTCLQTSLADATSLESRFRASITLSLFRSLESASCGARMR